MPDGWPAGVDRLVLPQVDSTNDEAARRFADGLTRPLWVLALQQTAARGRRGRPWAMPLGNFAATLVMPVDLPAADAGLRSFVAALALNDALAGLAPGARLTLKWPNDVLLNDGKVAGILLEAAGQGGRVRHLAVGIGVNLAAAPDPAQVEPGALRPVSVAGETGLTTAPDALLTPLAAAFARWDATLTAQGFPALRDAFLARAARLGEPMTARTGTDVVEGLFDTIDDTGALVIATATGRRAIAAADVFFRQAG